MKTIIKTMLVALMFTSSLVFADVQVIGISPAISSEDKATLSKFIEHNFNTITTGDALIIVDASTNQRITTILANGEFSSGDNPERRMKIIVKYFPSEVGALRGFLKRVAVPPVTEGNMLRFLGGLGSLNSEFPKSKIRVAFFGNPVVKEPIGLSLENRYPGDGNLFDPNSPYNTQSKQAALKGMDVHLIHSQGLTEFSSLAKDFHIERLKRFWTHYVAGLGGQLKTFSGASQSLTNWKVNSYQTISVDALNRNEKPLFYELRAPQLIKDEKQTQIELWSNNVTTNPRPPNQMTGTLTLGIRWNRDVDVDLYARGSADDVELYYGTNTAPKFNGRHVKDIQNLVSLKESQGFETIIYTGDIDISKMPPVRINHFGGKSANPTEVELRVMFDSKLYFKKFRFPAGSGTGGSGNRDTDPSWAKVSLAELMNSNK